MDWRQMKHEEYLNEDKDYDPEQAWNIEGPTRKRTDAARKKSINDDLKKVNAVQRREQEQKRLEEVNKDLSEGRQMVERDMQGLDMERQLDAFKR